MERPGCVVLVLSLGEASPESPVAITSLGTHACLLTRLSLFPCNLALPECIVLLQASLSLFTLSLLLAVPFSSIDMWRMQKLRPALQIQMASQHHVPAIRMHRTSEKHRSVHTPIHTAKHFLVTSSCFPHSGHPLMVAVPAQSSYKALLTPQL